MRTQLEDYCRRSKLVGGGNSIVPRIENVAGPVRRKLVFAQLEQADIGPCALLWIKSRFDLGDGLHKIEVQTKSLRCSFDFLNRRSDWNISQHTEDGIGWFPIWRDFGIGVIGEIRKLARWRVQIAVRRLIVFFEPHEFWAQNQLFRVLFIFLESKSVGFSYKHGLNSSKLACRYTRKVLLTVEKQRCCNKSSDCNGNS